MSDVVPPAEPRRWSSSRIISAAVLIVIVLAAIAYGVYNLTQNGNSRSNTAINSGNLVAPTPSKSNSNTTKLNSGTSHGVNGPSHKTTSQTKSNTKSNSSTGVASNAGTASTNGSANPAGTPAPTAPSNQLTNTGPGDSALFSFMFVAFLGSVAHYGWRKHRTDS